LLELLYFKDESVRGSATKTLGEIGDPRAVDGLIGALGDKRWGVREKAVEALGKIGDPRALESLEELRHDNQYQVREAAASVIDKLERLMVEHDSSFAFVDMTGENISQVANTFTFGYLQGARTVDDLLIALRHADEDARFWAATMLGRLGDPQTMAPLLNALQDENRGVRSAAATALGEIGDPGAVEALLTTLHKADEGHEVHDRSEDAYEEEGMVPIGHDINWVKIAAIEALGKIGDARVVEDLLRLLHDEDPWIRQEAAEAVGLVGSLEVLETLLYRLDIDIYADEIYPAVHRLAMKFSQQRPRPACLPVYSQPRLLRWLRKKLWQGSILVNRLPRKIRGIWLSSRTYNS
jgi:HEAT repeat protein